MLIMTWVRNQDGGFTAYPTNIDCVRQIRRCHKQLAAEMRRIMQRLYCHEQTALFLYSALAARTRDAVSREKYLALAELQRKQLVHHKQMLLRLNVNIPSGCQTIWARIWQALLLHLGTGTVLTYIKYIKHRDLTRQLKLYEMIRRMNTR